MFSPEKVKALLLHENAEVRDEATFYLEKHFDRTLATADDLWQAIHKYGPDSTRRLLLALPRFGQSESSIAHLIEFARTAADTHFLDVVKIIPYFPIATIAEYSEKLLCTARLPDMLNGLITEIRGLYAASDSDLWDQILDRSRTMREDWDENTLEAGDLFAKTIIAHGADGWKPAVELLQGVREDSWQEVFAIQIAGGMKRTEVIPLLLPRLDLYDDMQAEAITDALIAMADPCVVDAIGGYHGKVNDDFLISAGNVLASYPIATSQQILLSWAKDYPDDGDPSRLALDLCYYLRRQLPDEPEVIEYLVSQIEHSHKIIAPMEFGEEGLLILSKMTGIQFPDAAKWEAQMASRRSYRVKHMFETRADWEESYPDEFSNVKVLPVTKSRTVGRNDPCPCGSGKKYKKCCLGQAPAAED